MHMRSALMVMLCYSILPARGRVAFYSGTVHAPVCMQVKQGKNFILGASYYDSITQYYGVNSIYCGLLDISGQQVILLLILHI